MLSHYVQIPPICSISPWEIHPIKDEHKAANVSEMGMIIQYLRQIDVIRSRTRQRITSFIRTWKRAKYSRLILWLSAFGATYLTPITTMGINYVVHVQAHVRRSKECYETENNLHDQLRWNLLVVVSIICLLRVVLWRSRQMQQLLLRTIEGHNYGFMTHQKATKRTIQTSRQLKSRQANIYTVSNGYN